MLELIVSAYRWVYLSMSATLGFGWSIVLLSCICSALMVPLMRAVADVVKREMEYQEVLLPQILKINQSYRTDRERHLHIQALYGRYGYSPLSATKKVLPLFVQIPFLLLTYFMLKGTMQLSGVQFLFLSDLGSADGLLRGVNLLPFLMTGINILTVFSTPGFTHRDWAQAIGISLLFLVLLYGAPSALLLYWTLNNLISLIRTLASNCGTGGRLLAMRVRKLPALAAVIIQQDVLIWLSFVFFLASVYSWLLSYFLMKLAPSFNLLVLYRGMTFVVAGLSVLVFGALRKTKSGCRWLACVSMIACVGFALFLSALYVLSRTQFIRFFEVFNLFAVDGGLLVLAAFPLFAYCFGRAESTFFGTVFKGLRSQGYLLLMSIALAIHYSYSSEVFTLPFGSLVLLALYLILPIILLYGVLAGMFRQWINGDFLLRLSVAYFVGIYIMPMISTESGWLDFKTNILLRIGVIVLLAGAFAKIKDRVAGVVLVTLFLAVSIVTSIMNHGRGFASERGDAGVHKDGWNSLGEITCVHSNNVYLLVYDSYAHKVMFDGLGLRNDDIYKELVLHGFQLYDAYSTEGDTISSMSTAFAINGVFGQSRETTMAGDNLFCDFLKSAGYSTSYLLCGYDMPNRGERMPGDFYYPRPSNIVRPEEVLFPCIIRGTLSQSPSVFNSYTQEEWLEEYRAVMAKCSRFGNFVYAHSAMPGHVNWMPRERLSDDEERTNYMERVALANCEIKKSLALVDADPDAIVIIASDHGGGLMLPHPYGNYDCRHLLDKFGILLAIRWPADYEPCLELRTLQNVMLEVLIYLSGNCSLARFQNENPSCYLQYPISAPSGLVRLGIMQKGIYQGKTLGAAAKMDFSKNEGGAAK